MRNILAPLALAVMVLLAAAPASAQSITWGFTGGLDLATFGGDHAQDGTTSPDHRAGMRLGGTLTYSLSDLVSIRPELAYAQKGAVYKFDGEQVSYRFGYIDLPLLAQLSPRMSGPVQPFLTLGPAFSYMAACSIREEEANTVTTLDCDDSSVNFQHNKLDVAMVVGGGVAYPMGGGTVTLDSRYGAGLRSIDDSGASIDIKNRGFSFAVGYQMVLGR